MQRFAARLALVLLGLLLAATIGFLLGRGSPSEPRIDAAPVVHAIRRVAKLATVEVEVADVVRFEEVRTILLLKLPKNAVLRIRGRVLGGFDLEKGLKVDARPAERRIVVSLPRPQILAVDSRIEWFDESSGWLNPITPEDRTRWSSWARGHLGRAAKDAGIEERAARHARELLTEAGAALGWKVEVHVADVPDVKDGAGKAPPPPSDS